MVQAYGGKALACDSRRPAGAFMAWHKQHANTHHSDTKYLSPYLLTDELMLKCKSHFEMSHATDLCCCQHGHFLLT